MKDKKKDQTPVEKLSFNPFSALSSLKEKLPEGKAGAPQEKKQPPKPAAKRAVIRLERKGHGGKEMTRIEKLELSSSERETWLKELRQSLGCGGLVEGDDLLLQGDQRERVKTLLSARGVKVQG